MQQQIECRLTHRSSDYLLLLFLSLLLLAGAVAVAAAAAASASAINGDILT